MCKALEKACYVEDEWMEAARFVKKSVFEKVMGYDENLVFGEDWDLHERIRNSGFRIARINAFIKHNEGSLSLKKSVLKKFQYGKTLALYKTKQPKRSRNQLRPIRMAFIKNWQKLSRDPVHASGMFIMKFCEFAAVRLAYLTSGKNKQTTSLPVAFHKSATFIIKAKLNRLKNYLL